MTINELVKAVLCLALAQALPDFAAMGRAAAVWFVTQAGDELFNGNLWDQYQWEYPLLAALMLLAYITKK